MVLKSFSRVLLLLCYTNWLNKLLPEMDSDNEESNDLVLAMGKAGDIEFEPGEEHLVSQFTNESVYCGRKLVTHFKVPGNIHSLEFRSFWTNTLKPTEMTLAIIRDGYKLPFRAIPPKTTKFKNNKSARIDDQFVRAEVDRLCKLGCLSKVSSQPHLVLPLSSVFSKKKRLVVDGSRHLNPFLEHRRVRLSDLRDVPDVIKPGMFLGSEDLDSGYWHVKIAEEHRTFLGCHIIDPITKKPIFYVWNVLFLGVSDAVFLFTAILRPVKQHISSLGIPSILYLDDLLYGGATEKESIENRKLVIETLGKAGFIVSTSKSTKPSRQIRFLGLIIDTVQMLFLIPEDKLIKIEDFARKLLLSRRVRLRDAAKFLGFLNSVSKAIGPMMRLRVKAIYNWLAENLLYATYNHHFPITDLVRQEIEFWLLNVRSLNGYAINPSASVLETRLDEILVVSDASNEGAFGYMLSSSYEVILRRSFTDEEKKMSSTFRELIALYNIYSNEDILKKMQGKNVLHCTDNMAVSSILFNGSKKPHLLDLALKIFIKCRQFKVNLEVEWRPRNHYLLELADAGSKSFDDSSYSLNFESFSVVLEYFHDVPIHVDGMSENWNKKSNYYYSKKRDPFSSGVNFFAQSLDHNVNYYIFPPPSNIYQTIIHLAIHKAKGLLIVPHWPGSSFYLNIVPDGKHFSKWVIKFLKFRPTGFCYDVNIRSSTFKQSPSTFDMIILHFDFSIVNEFNFHHADVSRTKCIDHGCDKCS